MNSPQAIRDGFVAACLKCQQAHGEYQLRLEAELRDLRAFKERAEDVLLAATNIRIGWDSEGRYWLKETSFSPNGEEIRALLKASLEYQQALSARPK